VSTPERWWELIRALQLIESALERIAAAVERAWPPSPEEDQAARE
jgi:hypothetical protein